MALTVKAQTFVREVIEEGVYLGRCVQVIDLGTQKNEKFQNESAQVHIGWELLGEKKTFKDKEGAEMTVPVIVSKRYTASLGEKASLRADLEKWRGKKFTEQELEGFDISKLINVPCQIQIVHTVSKTNGNTYANVSGILAPVKGTPIPAAESKPLLYDMERDGDKVPEGLPEFLFDVIRKSPEYEAFITGSPAGAAAPAGEFSDAEGGDDIPF